MKRLWAKSFVRDRWLSIDHRTLGLFRIAFGLCLIGNLYEHAVGENLVAFFTNDGVLTNHFALYAPIQPREWSILFAFSEPGEVALGFLGILTVYVLFVLGYKTKVMQILLIICIVSLANRNLLLQDGGSFASTALAAWTVFLPLGARFSLDRWLEGRAGRSSDASSTGEALGRSWPEDAPRHVSFVCLALLLQLAFIYGFNAANKTGQTWRNGSALHYILWQNSRNTAFAGFIRLHEPAWFSPLFTKGTLLFESAAPFLLLTPFFQTWARRSLVVSMWLFHAGIASFMSLGLFSYVMMAYGVLLLGPDDWRILEPRMERVAHATGEALAARPRLRDLLHRWRGREPVAPTSADWMGGVPKWIRWTLLSLRESLALLLFIACVTELTLTNDVVPPRFRLERRPEWMANMLYYLRIYQTWGMFSADPPLSDGIVVVDALLADGTHIDPLSGAPPDLDAPLHGPWLRGHDWSEYMSYYPSDRHRAFREGLRDYLLNLDRASGRPEAKRIRSLQIYWVIAQSPPPGSLRPYDIERSVMTSYVVPPGS